MVKRWIERREEDAIDPNRIHRISPPAASEKYQLISSHESRQHPKRISRVYPLRISFEICFLFSRVASGNVADVAQLPAGLCDVKFELIIIILYIIL